MKSDNDLKKRSGADLRAQLAARSRPPAAPVKSRLEQLDEYREVVVTGQRNFVAVGTALGLIARDRLFREAGYASFDAMVVAEFDMATSTAYRLVDAARVVTILSQVGTIESKIANQSQALALAPLVKDRDAMVLVITAAEARGGRLTASLLADVAVELYPHIKVIDGELVGDRPPLVAGMRAAIESAADKQQQTSPGPAGPVDGEEDAANLGGRAVSSEPPTSGPVPTSPGDGSGETAAVPGLRAADEEPQVRAGLSERGSSAGDGGSEPHAAVPGNPQAGPGKSASDSGVPGPAADDGASADRPSSAAPHNSPVPGGPGETADDVSRDSDRAGDETGPEVPPPGAPASDLVDGREQQATAGVSVPAAPGPEIPQWLTAISRFCSAAHGLDEQDPVAVRPVINADLVEELRAAIEMAHIWFLLLEDDAEKGANA